MTPGAYISSSVTASLVVQPAMVSVATLNANIWGSTGRIGPSYDTDLVTRPEYRAEAIVNRIENLSETPDVFGFTEIWDDGLRRQMQESLSHIYPYAATSPVGRGINQLIDSIRGRWPRTTRWIAGEASFEDKVRDLVHYITHDHYDSTDAKPDKSLLQGAMGLFPEDWKMLAARRGLGLPAAWGAGLLLLSKYPLENPEFFMHPRYVELERFTQKGVLQAAMQHPSLGPITLLLTHMQEAKSVRAERAQLAQLQQIARLAEASLYPVIGLGDFNIEASLPVYQQMLSILNLSDSYREIHPDVQEKPGYTFDGNTPFSRKRDLRKRAPDAWRQRLDYILRCSALRAVASRVLEREFFDDKWGEFLSDHFGVFSTFQAVGA